MSYIVMECHPGYAVLLDEDGRFLKAANLHYEVGQTVYDPVLMKEKPDMRKRVLHWSRSGFAAAAACFLLFFGFRYYQTYLQPYSSIYLKINPEVQMDLNRKGTVVSLTGTNEDGKELLEGYSGRGKDKVTVADELIDRAIEMGFLSEGGQISFSIDTPDEVLFQEYGTELRTKVTEHMDGGITVTIEIVNFKSKPQEAPGDNARPASVSPENLPDDREGDSGYAPDSDFDGEDDGDTDYSVENTGSDRDDDPAEPEEDEDDTEDEDTDDRSNEKDADAGADDDTGDEPEADDGPDSHADDDGDEEDESDDEGEESDDSDENEDDGDDD